MLDLRSVFAGKAVLFPIKVRSEKLAKNLFKVKSQNVYGAMA